MDQETGLNPVFPQCWLFSIRRDFTNWPTRNDAPDRGSPGDLKGPEDPSHTIQICNSDDRVAGSKPPFPMAFPEVLHREIQQGIVDGLPTHWTTPCTQQNITKVAPYVSITNHPSWAWLNLVMSESTYQSLSPADPQRSSTKPAIEAARGFNANL